jgi:hypothetical protein
VCGSTRTSLCCPARLGRSALRRARTIPSSGENGRIAAGVPPSAGVDSDPENPAAVPATAATTSTVMSNRLRTAWDTPIVLGAFPRERPAPANAHRHDTHTTTNPLATPR